MRANNLWVITVFYILYECVCQCFHFFSFSRWISLIFMRKEVFIFQGIFFRSFFHHLEIKTEQTKRERLFATREIHLCTLNVDQFGGAIVRWLKILNNRFRTSKMEKWHTEKYGTENKMGRHFLYAFIKKSIIWLKYLFERFFRERLEFFEQLEFFWFELYSLFTCKMLSSMFFFLAIA